MKKALCLLMASMLIMLAGCGTGSSTTSPEASANETAAEASAATSTDTQTEGAATVSLPISTDGATLSLFTGMMPPSMTYIDSMEQCLVFEEMEKRTGVHVTIQAIHPSTQSEKFSLMAASGDFTDLINDPGGMYSGGINKALSDDVIINLTDLVKEFAPNYWSIISADEAVYRDTTTDSGDVAVFYNVFAAEQASWFGPVVRQDWLTEQGLTSPTTYDEYENVLKVFKEKYDATLWIPATGVTGNEWLTSGYGIAALYTGNSSAIPFYVQDGVVKCGWEESGFRDYLTMMNKWYGEGLVYSDYISGDSANVCCSNDALSLITTEKVGIWYAQTDDMSTYKGAIGKDTVDVRAIAYPTQNEGDTLHIGYYNAQVNAAAYAISSSCEDPELATKWINYWYSDEGKLLCNWGIEDQTFTYDADGNPEYTDLILNNSEGMPFNVALFVYTRDSGPFILDRTRTTRYYDEAQAEAEGIWTANYDAAYTMPTTISLDEDASQTFTQYAGDINTYVSEMVNKYISGEEDLSGFDSYVSTLASMGLKDCIALYQAAYDSYSAKTLS